MQEIDEIRARLKAAYGNPMLLLKKKIAEISRISQLWKLQDPSKLAEALSRIINAMKDLQRLASEHGIESLLYRGNGLERIYQLLGDNRVTRWLFIMCGESQNDETLWIKLIDSLEKDLRAQQQKVLIQNKVEEKKPAKQNNVYGKQNGWFKSHFTANSTG